MHADVESIFTSAMPHTNTHTSIRRVYCMAWYALVSPLLVSHFINVMDSFSFSLPLYVSISYLRVCVWRTSDYVPAAHNVFKWKIQENGSRCNLLVICTVASRLLLLLLAFDGDGDVGWVVMVLSVPYNV